PAWPTTAAPDGSRGSSVATRLRFSFHAAGRSHERKSALDSALPGDASVERHEVAAPGMRVGDAVRRHRPIPLKAVAGGCAGRKGEKPQRGATHEQAATPLLHDGGFERLQFPQIGAAHRNLLCSTILRRSYPDLCRMQVT